MACETCGHAMQNVVFAEDRRIFWCPRCGTLKTETENHTEIKPPMLAERVRMMDGWPRTTDADRMVVVVDLPLWLWLAVMESAGIGPEAARKNVGA